MMNLLNRIVSMFRPKSLPQPQPTPEEQRQVRIERALMGYWVQADGVEVHLSQVSDHHLLNIWHLLCRRAQDEAKKHNCTILAYPEPNGEMAADAYWAAAEEELEDGFSDWQEIICHFAIYKPLMAELEQRGLMNEV